MKYIFLEMDNGVFMAVKPETIVSVQFIPYPLKIVVLVDAVETTMTMENIPLINKQQQETAAKTQAPKYMTYNVRLELALKNQIQEMLINLVDYGILNPEMLKRFADRREAVIKLLLERFGKGKQSISEQVEKSRKDMDEYADKIKHAPENVKSSIRKQHKALESALTEQEKQLKQLEEQLENIEEDNAIINEIVAMYDKPKKAKSYSKTA